MQKYDIIFVLPYLFSDHPSFPEGILKRVLESHGFSVGVIETPSWQDPGSFTVLGSPRLFFAVIPGPVDSVVLNYTATRKRRREDLYQEIGDAFFSGCPPSIKHKIRPDRTVVVVDLFNRINNKLRRKVELAPYLFVGHPGETMKDVFCMANRLRMLNVKTTDVQIFTPTPGTLSTAMYCMGVSVDFR
jgi:radical SAM superfamily enzyme YgiQ (UPF0313 family)